MSLLNTGGCDHEYLGQPGCVCSLPKRLRDRAKEWEYLSDDRGHAVGDMREAADTIERYENPDISEQEHQRQAEQAEWEQRHDERMDAERRSADRTKGVL